MCITFVQCWTSAEDVGSTFTNVLCVLRSKPIYEAMASVECPLIFDFYTRAGIKLRMKCYYNDYFSTLIKEQFIDIKVIATTL